MSRKTVQPFRYLVWEGTMPMALRFGASLAKNMWVGVGAITARLYIGSEKVLGEKLRLN